MVNELALCHGSHWYTNKRLFLSKFNHSAFIRKVQEETSYHVKIGSDRHLKREPFIQHYYDNYHTPALPPIWMLSETFSLGILSTLFANLIDRHDQKLICKPFGLDYQIMGSWLHSLTYLRNLCAHHSRLWDRRFTIKPKIAKKYQKQLSLNSHFSTYAAILQIFIKIISPRSHWKQHLRELIKSYPHFYQTKIGFANDWEKDPFWSR